MNSVRQFARPMELGDIPQVSKIEREAFPPPWPATNFRRDLTVNTSTDYLVACEELSEKTWLATDPDALNSDKPSPESKLEMIRTVIGRLLGRAVTPQAPRQFILGFAALWFLADEAHLANIAVREAYRQQGVGEHLLIAVIKLAMERNALFITLEVRAANKVAQALYRKYGFVEVGIRRGYYTDNKEDAILMTVDGITSASFEDNFLNLVQAYAQKFGGKVIV